jgi:hypothetical protein
MPDPPGRWLRPALWLLALHVALLCLPPIPPDVDGSLWSYLVGYAAALSGVLAFREREARLAAAWAARSEPVRFALGLGAGAVCLLGALALRAAAPRVFQRFGDESGLFEPATFVCYAAGALHLWRAAAAAQGAARRHLQLLAGVYALLVLEEVDYLGIFGAFLGKPGGVYTGALHDLVSLFAHGVLGAGAAAALAAALAGLAWLAWRRAWLSPLLLAAQLRSRDLAWALAAAALLAVAAVLDTRLVHWFGLPTLEEALELPASIWLLAYAFERARKT